MCLSVNFKLIRVSRLLLHTETADGSVIPIWEEVRGEDVAVLKDVMASRQTAADGVKLDHIRIPITAEHPPDFSDLSELIDVVVRYNSSNTPIVVNCQLGRGRSTLTSVSQILFCIYSYSGLQCPRTDHSTFDTTMVGEQSNTSPHYSFS